MYTASTTAVAATGTGNSGTGAFLDSPPPLGTASLEKCLVSGPAHYALALAMIVGGLGWCRRRYCRNGIKYPRRPAGDRDSSGFPVS